MKFKVFSIRDDLTGFMTPTVEISVPVAVRNFEHAVLHAGSLFDSHPGDFNLYYLGEFDTDSGVLIPCDPIERVASGMSVHLKSLSEGGDKE